MKSWVTAIWVAFGMVAALLVTAHALAAPVTQATETPLRPPAVPAERFGILSPYTALGSGIDGASLVFEPSAETTAIVPRGTITERMTVFAHGIDSTSPYYGRTWLTYYGRPGIPVMGILGEYEIDELIDLLKEQAREYEIANGYSLSVYPALHLVYGMATKAPGDDGSHLDYLDDAIVTEYITKAAEADFAVILDVQIGALSAVDSISKALPYLAHDNVHLAIDPEFAMVHPGQYWPGDPIGYLTADQINEAESAIQRYLRRNRIKGDRVLLVHQFQANMILDPEKIDRNVDQVALTISVDGWGGPWAKTSKYNSLVTPDSPFVAFKLFYRWDDPILTPSQALGEESIDEIDSVIDVTPNMIIYQ